MSIEKVLAEDRRLVMLRCLSEAKGFQLNESTLRHALRVFAHHVDHDLMRADVAYLEKHGLVRTETLSAASGELVLVTLTEAGSDVAEGTPHPGVARRTPD